MRIALHAAGEAGRRASRVLLAERDLIALGLYGHPAAKSTEDRRMTAITDITGFDLLCTDTTVDPLGFARIAAEEGISCVLAADVLPEAALAARFRAAGNTLLTGAGLASGIAESLAARELEYLDARPRVRISWTEPGKPLGSGEAVPFPDPVGASWGRKLPRDAADRVETIRVAAPIEGEWAAAVAEVSGTSDGAPVRRVIGVADHAAHLEALALAAGVAAVAAGAAGPGARRPAEIAADYLAAALRMGMDVAAFTAAD
jgi:hypothetical protein